MRARKRLLLVGAGHTHIEVLRRFGAHAEPDVDIAVVVPQRSTPYSGMLPGLVAGHYTVDDIHIDAAAVTAYARARFVTSRVVALDLTHRQATTDADETIGFDVASLDIGSTPSPPAAGVREHMVAVKPVSAFVPAWNAMRADAGAGRIASIAVVGAGAGGVETLLAMEYAMRGIAPIAWHLIGDTDAIMAQHAAAVRKRVGRVLARRGVALHLGTPAVAITREGVQLGNGTIVAADRVVWTTNAAAQRWPQAAGLATDAAGFIAVDDCLRSVSHPFVFAAGDCATQIAHPRPKSGVYAVRQGAPLAANLRRALRDESPRPFVPQRTALALISTGERCAVASFGRFAIAGRWVWRWKDAIDRRFVASYRRIAADAAIAPPRTGR